MKTKESVLLHLFFACLQDIIIILDAATIHLFDSQPGEFLAVVFSPSTKLIALKMLITPLSCITDKLNFSQQACRIWLV